MELGLSGPCVAISFRILCWNLLLVKVTTASLPPPSSRRLQPSLTHVLCLPCYRTLSGTTGVAIMFSGCTLTSALLCTSSANAMLACGFQTFMLLGAITGTVMAQRSAHPEPQPHTHSQLATGVTRLPPRRLITCAGPTAESTPVLFVPGNAGYYKQVTWAGVQCCWVCVAIELCCRGCCMLLRLPQCPGHVCRDSQGSLCTGV